MTLRTLVRRNPGHLLLSLFALGACSPVQQAASVGSALVSSVTAPDEPSLSAGELRQLQSRELEAPKPATFAGVMTVLLDSGYRVQSADLESGLITAVAPSSGRLRVDPTGVGRATQTPVASAFVEELRGGSSRVRITFAVGTSGAGQLGVTGEKPVLDSKVYAAFFAQLEEELASRRPASEPGPIVQTQEEPSRPVPPPIPQETVAAPPVSAGAQEPPNPGRQPEPPDLR